MIAYPPRTLVIDGEKYIVGFNDQNAKGRLEEIIASRVWDRVYSEATRMKNAEMHLKRYEKLFAEGYFATMGEGWRNEILCHSGVFDFLFSLLLEHQPEMTLDMVVDLFKKDANRCAHAIVAIAPDFFKAVLRQMGVTEEEIEKATPGLVEALSSLTQEPATAQTS